MRVCRTYYKAVREQVKNKLQFWDTYETFTFRPQRKVKGVPSCTKNSPRHNTVVGCLELKFQATGNLTRYQSLRDVAIRNLVTRPKNLVMRPKWSQFHENVSIETTTFENHVGNQPIFLCCKPGEPVDLGINCDLEFDQTFRPGLF